MMREADAKIQLGLQFRLFVSSSSSSSFASENISLVLDSLLRMVGCYNIINAAIILQRYAITSLRVELLLCLCMM
jgi:hypothetical protein